MKCRLLLGFVGFALAFFSSAGTTRAADAPNVIMILTDDQGWMDSGVYGSEYYDTPHMDRLAAQGVRFTNAYSASPLCSPTRLSVLTGMYPHRYGMTAPHGHLATIPLDTPLFRPGQTGAAWQAYLVPESARSLPNDAPTYGKVFKQAGYATAFMGKWHLGKPPYMPENHGFDVVVGGRGNPGPPGGFFSPWNSDTLPQRPHGTHIDDAMRLTGGLNFQGDCNSY
jgi:arylsulfatase A-like enzyme